MMNTALEQLPGLATLSVYGKPGGGRAASDIFEREQDWEILVELPGVSLEDVSVRLDGRHLIVEAAAGGGGGPGQGRRIHAGRLSGPVREVFRLPGRADGEQLAATLNAGVLTITVGKKRSSDARQILVEAG